MNINNYAEHCAYRVLVSFEVKSPGFKFVLSLDSVTLEQKIPLHLTFLIFKEFGSEKLVIK